MAVLRNPQPRQFLESLDAVHQAIHERGMYVISRTFTAVANDGFADIHFIPPAGAEAHTRIVVSAEAKAYVKTYTRTTYSNPGTTITPFNRATNGDPSPTLAYHTPTVTQLGTPRVDDLIPGGTGGNAIGGAVNPEFETVVAGGTDFLIRVQNKGGTAKDINITINYYLREEY